MSQDNTNAFSEKLIQRLHTLYVRDKITCPDQVLSIMQREFPGIATEQFVAAAVHLHSVLAVDPSFNPNEPPENMFQGFQGLPMPKYDGPEPSEFEVQRIRKYLEDGRFTELSKEHQDWICYRLMPSLSRFGFYPPPEHS